MGEQQLGTLLQIETWIELADGTRYRYHGHRLVDARDREHIIDEFVRCFMRETHRRHWLFGSRIGPLRVTEEPCPPTTMVRESGFEEIL